VSDPTRYDPPMVITAHGIRTYAEWQLILAETLSNHRIRFRSYRYGYFNLLRYLSRRSRDAQVRKFLEFYQRLVSENKDMLRPDDPLKRPSVIAHSFGTFIVANCLYRHEEIKIDKLILLGSVLPIGFEWQLLFARGQVNFVRNEKGLRDIPVQLTRYAVPGTGPSGRRGFHFAFPHFTQKDFEFEHSDHFYELHATKQWFPFRRQRPIPYRVIEGSMITDDKQFEELLDCAHRIDLEEYSALLGYQEADLPRGKSMEWIRIEPDIYTFLLLEDELIGYVNAMPVARSIANRLKTTGDLNEKEIEADDLASFHSEGDTCLYLASIAIARHARSPCFGTRQPPFEHLLLGLTEKLIRYALGGGSRVTEFIAVGWTVQGRKLCEDLGMETVRKHKYGYPIYSLDFEQVTLQESQKVHYKLRRLANVYRGLNRR
jgi:hypothetical protein